MIYVVGRESSVLGYSFYNSELIYNITTKIFELPLLLKQERVFKNRFGQMIYEDILHFKNQKSDTIIEDDIMIEKARNIASNMLSETAEKAPHNKNINFLIEAIEKANKINQSEICYQ